MTELKINELVDKINWLTLYSQSTLKYKNVDSQKIKLTNSQIIFLKYVKIYNSITSGKLALLLKTTPSFSSRLTSQLEDLGYIKRRHKPDKRKEVFVELTPKGEKVLEKITLPENERRKKIAELINEGFGEDGLRFVNEIIDYMIDRFKNGSEVK